MANPGDARVLITGIGGFTGRHLARHLSRQGWMVSGIGDAPDMPQLPVREIDINDTAAIAAWLRQQQPTHIVHLAALSHVVGDPLSFYRVNVLGTESLLDAVGMAGLQPRKLLIASSANVYGNSSAGSIDEDAPLMPMNHYALSKAAMELMVRKWFDRLPIVLARPFNYTGPGQSANFLVPKIVAHHRERAPRIRLGNIAISRDISSVSHVCAAYAALLPSDAQGCVLNICSGRSTSIEQMLDAMAELSGHRPIVEVDPQLVRKDEVIELRGDPSRLYAAIGRLEPPAMGTILQEMYAGTGTD